MSINGLDHVNIRSRDPARTLDFFRDVLLMKVGIPPGAPEGYPGGWVYDTNELPILHVGSANQPYPSDDIRPFTPTDGGGAIHHVALACSDFEGTRTRLEALELPYTENEVAMANLRQLFVSEPNGILLELNFRDQ